MTVEEIAARLRSSNEAAVELVSRLDGEQWSIRAVVDAGDAT